MDELNIPYAVKNIGLHSKELIKRTLISRTEDVLRRMRWKLFFIRNPTFRTQKERFGFRTTESPPAMPELFQFESDLISMIKNVKFKPANNELNRKIRRDLNEIKQKEKILVKGDKSRRILLGNQPSNQPINRPNQYPPATNTTTQIKLNKQLMRFSRETILVSENDISGVCQDFKFVRSLPMQ